LKKKIIASSISNLTDARYFAGWMVDFIVFNIDPKHEFYTNPQEIGAFQSWVEGPQYVLEMGTDQYAFCEKYLVDFNCQFILIPFSNRALVSTFDVPLIFSLSMQEYDTYYDLLQDINASYVLQVNNVKDALQLLSKKPLQEIYLDLSDAAISEEELLDKHLTGYMVHGSPEEKVGFKSFDELDEIFEVLQDF